MKIEFKYEGWQQAIERLVREEDRRAGRLVTEVFLDIHSFADLLKEAEPRSFLFDPMPLRQRVARLALSPDLSAVRHSDRIDDFPTHRVVTIRCL